MKVVFVLFDSLVRKALGCYGSHDIKTPNFDRFSKKGVTFDTHYVGSLPCMPARRDIHSGRLNFMHRSWGPLEPFDNSFVQMLKDKGIYSHLVTDHQHYFEEGGWRYPQAFDTWDFIRGQENDPWKAMVQPPLERFKETYDTRHYPPTSKKRMQHAINREWMKEESDFPTARCFASAFEFLDTNREADDWLLWLECFDPHEPFHAPERFRQQYSTGYQGKVLNWPIYEKVNNTPQEIAEIQSNYAALVSMCDEYFGRLLDYFDEHNLWEDTMLVMSTDHGFLLSEHDWWGKNRQPYYEEIAHIPMIIAHPQFREQAGTRRQGLTQTPDLMPTLLDAFGIEPPPETRAKSVLPLLKKDQQLRDAIILGMFGGPICVTDGRYTYYRYPDNIATSENLFEYTLMPTHMNSPFTLEELDDMELVAPFDFTKDVRLLKIRARSNAARPPDPDVTAFGDLGTRLYDVREDPQQLNPDYGDNAITQRLTRSLVKILAEHDAPAELYRRFDLTAPGGAKIT